ncbi:MAG: lytic transglycosylase domain-containing protein [Chthoniobacterales bacterium]
MGTTKKQILFLVSGLAVCGVAVAFLFLIKDPVYRLNELVFYGRYHRYDVLIETAGKQYGVDPNLIRAVIWRESQFQSGSVGKHGERGLMQVMEIAANEWAKDEKIADFKGEALFDPKTNISAGTWRLSKALKHWSKSDNPMPFALAEYNAGRSRVVKWADPSGNNPTTSAEKMKARMNFPNTRAYVNAIMERYDYYQSQRQ